MMEARRVLLSVLLGVLVVQLVAGRSTDEGPVDRDVQGPKGDPAPNQGNRGPPGRPGYPGIPGPKGEAGQGGLPGLDGMPGLPGRKGERGDYGDKGHEGLPGIKGQAGSPGLPGLPGMDGLKGQYGGKGHPGDTGMPGRPGSPGEPGFQGLNGMKGARGYKGGPCECGNPQTPRKRAVAFSAEVDNVPQPSLHSLPVPVTRIMADVGSWFQLNVSRFIAPSTGVYAFSLVTISEGSVAIPISLVHNGQEVMYTGRTDTSMGIYPVGANRIFLNLSRDDYVDVRVRPKEQGVVSSLADLFYSETRMTFLGYKLMY